MHDEELTQQDFRDIRIISMVLLVASLIEQAHQEARLPGSPDKRAVDAISNMLSRLMTQFGSGVQLRADAIALAGQLGIEIEEFPVSPVANA